MQNSFNKGIGVLEILLGLSAFVILAAIIVLAMSPTRQLSDARNAQRFADLNSIVNAIYKYALDNGGRLPDNIPEQATEICAGSLCSASLIDLSSLVGEDNYLMRMPIDPKAKGEGSGYKIEKEGDKIIISAPNAELGEKVLISR
ncbi:MAG TPA: hypothetical protein PLA41_00890 [Candidatus Pacearchaeota archaeon]|nr:hypothetical protein [Candidatus Parcubacteria bacterium]HNZ83916.1 hypothetical protein [Candidatus Pacearchaeota archaeon]HOU45692.1 hypothetical protein [Candidatus Pacearchaeota archaeon]HPM08493.1 hypothetical protein [Candidatus Pacearchaeota archaeon]HQI74814.1 hypothetical protein [Candidatus Pacearchaeota archaeon]